MKKMSRKDRKERGLVKLLKYINGAWQVVDYGVPQKAEVYAALGYVVER